MIKKPEFTVLEGIAYLVGAIGIQLSTVMVAQWSAFYYAPAAGSENKIFFVSVGMATAMMVIGRVFDAVSDPVVGYWSDKTRSKWGRRKPFLIIGSIIHTIVFILFWLPPVQGSSILNFFWGTFFATAYYWAITVVLVPYIALAPEIARTTEDRILLGKYTAMGMIVGLVLGNFTGAMIEMIGMKTTAIIIGLTSLVFFQFAGWAIKERYRDESEEIASSLKDVFKQMSGTLNNRPFLIFVLAETIFTLGFFVIQIMLPDFNKVILKKDEGFVTVLLLPFLAVCIPLLFVVGPIVKKWNKKITYAMGMFGFAVLFPLFGIIGALSIPLSTKIILILIVVGVAGAPQAIKYVMPTVMIGEIADYGETITGHRREAIYAGAIGFGTKTAMSLSYIIRLAVYSAAGGYSVDNPKAILLIGPVVAVISMIGFFVFLAKYPVLHVVKDEINSK
ncbi:MFS transporter [bacterium]